MWYKIYKLHGKQFLFLHLNSSYLEARYVFIFVLKLSAEINNLIFIGTLFQILVRHIFEKGLKYLLFTNSNLKLCVL